MPKLHIILASTRPTRIGHILGDWIKKEVDAQGNFDTEIVDLLEQDLPIFDEPEHPRLQQYKNAHTKKWAAKVNEADAFIFVLPEYDYFTPAPLVNAIQYLTHEWAYKPVVLLSYSTGVSGGLRSAQTTKLLVTSVNMMPLADGIAVPFLKTHLNEKGEFVPDERIKKTAAIALTELAKWTTALMTLRKN